MVVYKTINYIVWIIQVSWFNSGSDTYRIHSPGFSTDPYFLRFFLKEKSKGMELSFCRTEWLFGESLNPIQNHLNCFFYSSRRVFGKNIVCPAGHNGVYRKHLVAQ